MVKPLMLSDVKLYKEGEFWHGECVGAHGKDAWLELHVTAKEQRDALNRLVTLYYDIIE